jgi:cyclic lactone autoinducer peptide
MELLKSILEKIFGVMIEGSLISDANRTTCMIVYQPKVPSDLKKFSKINKE